MFSAPNSSPNRVRRLEKEDVPRCNSRKHNAKVMVWGMFHILCQSFILIRKTSKSTRSSIVKISTLSITESKVLPAMSGAIFKQDSTQPEMVVINNEWLQLNGKKIPRYWRKGEWPGNSPNLNSITNLWSAMKQELIELVPFTSLIVLERKYKKTVEKL